MRRNDYYGTNTSSPESGQALIEYAILASLISIAAVALLMLVGASLPAIFAAPLNAL